MKSLPVAIQRRAVDHKSHRVSVLEGQMPRYIFAIRARDGDAPWRATRFTMRPSPGHDRTPRGLFGAA